MAQRRVIFLEGNIGAGKSTLGNRLKATGHFEFIPEPVAVWREKGMLKKFYDAPPRWAFTFQWAAFMTRAKTWHDIITTTDHSRVVLERSIYCDLHVFAKNCYETGFMDEDEWLLDRPDALVHNGKLGYTVEELLNLVEYGPNRVAYSPPILHSHAPSAAGGGAQSTRW